MLQLDQVRKAYGSRIILHLPSLIIPAGMYWIRGGNGSGKTTLMKIIAGINPFEGTVTFNGLSLTAQPLDYRRQVSYAEAEPVFPGFLTGWELIRFVQKTRNASDAQVDELVDHFQIRSFLSYAVGTYSSGMTKKLSLVMAFLGSPGLILLDEPLILLEDASLPLLFAMINKKQQEGVMLLLTSHQPFTGNDCQPTGIITVQNQTAQFLS